MYNEPLRLDTCYIRSNIMDKELIMSTGQIPFFLMRFFGSDTARVTLQGDDIILSPVPKTKEKKPRELKGFGIAHKYANPDLIPLEKTAWEMAVMEKHGKGNKENS
jgi:hypothetical protein